MSNHFILNTLIFIGLALVFIASPFRFIKELGDFSNPLFLFGGLLLLIAALISLTEIKFSMNNDARNFTFLYGGFIFFAVISMLINADIANGINSIERFILLFLILIVWLIANQITTEAYVVNSFLIISVGIFIYFMVAYPIPDMPFNAYKGGFGNPNSLGVLSVTVFSVSIVSAFGLIKMRQNYWLAIIYFLIGLAAAYFTAISASRTSFLTLIAITVLVVSVYLVSILKSRELLSIKNVFIVSFLMIGALVLFIVIDNPIYSAIDTNIIAKFERKLGNNGITDGRMRIWTVIVKDAGMFGKGVNHFREISGLGAHNSFFHIVSFYGWLAAFFYLGFWILALVKSIKYYLAERFTNAYALLPLIILMNFLLLSIMENMSNHVSVFLAMAMIGIMSTNKNKGFSF